MKASAFYLFVLFISAVLFYSCSKDNIVTTSAPYYEWTLFDSSANLSRIDITSDNALIYSGSSTNTYVVKNGAKTRLDLNEPYYWTAKVRSLSSNYIAFLNLANTDPFVPHTIKVFDNAVLHNINLPGRDFGISDFLILNKDYLLICGGDSLFYYKAGMLTAFKAPDSLRVYALAQNEGKIYAFTVNYSYSETGVYELNNTSFRFVSNENIRLTNDNITNKITGIRHNNGRYDLVYLTSSGWVNFYSTDIANISQLAGSGTNNFYFTGRDSQSGKFSGYFYDGNTTYEDNNFTFNDSLGISTNMLNNTIYKIKPGRTGFDNDYIYKGDLKR